MKKYILTVLLLLTVCLLPSCSDDVKYRIDPSLNPGTTIEPVDPVTDYHNSRSGGLVVSDSESDYFQYKEESSVVLYRRDRQNGTLTVLAERPWKEFAADVMFTNLCLKDGYLYFLLFDGNEGIRNVWCRVPVDGSAAYEPIHEFDWHFLSMFQGAGQVYVNLVTDDNRSSLCTFNVETGECTPVSLFDNIVTPMFTVGGYFYYETVRSTGSENIICLYRRPLDGSASELVWDHSESKGILAAVSGGKLYVYSFLTRSFYEAETDGSNAHVLLEDFPVKGLNVHNGVFYFLAGDASFTDGLYRYMPGDKFATLLYDVYYETFQGPFITGDGNVWFTSAVNIISSFRFGNPAFVDRNAVYHAVK